MSDAEGDSSKVTAFPITPSVNTTLYNDEPVEISDIETRIMSNCVPL